MSRTYSYPSIISHMLKKVNRKSPKSSIFAKKFKILSLFLGILLTFSPLISAPTFASLATATSNNFYFENYTADYYLSKDRDGISHLRVVEQFDAVFPDFNQNHGITRAIPYTNQAGENLTIKDPHNFKIKVQHNGKEEKPHKIEVERGDIIVYIGKSDRYVTGKQQYILEYEFERVITDFNDFQELYWDTNGDRWSQRFQNVTARVHFEDSEIEHGFSGDSWCYVGTAGETGSERCAISKISDGVSFQTSDLAASENLTFDLEFEPDTFIVPPPQPDYILVQFFTAECLIAGALIVFIIYVYSRIHEKRKYYKQLFETVQYLPPEGISVAEAAEIRSQRYGHVDQVATLIDLAVKHKIELIKNSNRKNKWSVRIKTISLTPEESTVLHILKGDRYTLVENETFEIRDHYSVELSGLVSDFSVIVQNNLVAKGLLEAGKPKNSTISNQESLMTTVRPATSHTTTEKLCVALVVSAIVWFILCILGAAHISENVMNENLVYAPKIFWPLMITVMIITTISLFACGIWFGWYASRTKKGLEMSRYLDGLKLYIEMAEKDRLAFLQSVNGADTSHQGIVNLYEKLLPYAIIFGQEKSWLEALGSYYAYDDVGNPSWYIGVGAFSANEFARAINSINQNVSSSISSASPSSSSSSSSGGGGGGFSGGGGGGGGGGGW